MTDSKQKKCNILTLNKYKRENTKAVMVTAYDFPQAQLAQQAGVDMILVGDSLGMTTLGYESTIPVTMEDMISHCHAVKRGADKTFIIGDMPFLSYQASDEDAVRNAGRFIQAGMDCIKLEGMVESRIKAISEAGIMVMGHLGLTPQSQAKLGGHRVQGKTKEAFREILDQAKRVQDAGCSFLLLEAMPVEPAKMIAEELSIPVYGIGAGDRTDGQLVIMHDLIGMFFEFKPKFAKRYCEAGKLIRESLESYCSEVRDGSFPSEENFYAPLEDF